MGLKASLILVIVLYFSYLSRKNALYGLCALIAFVGLMENRDWIPRALFGIPGLNAWNILFLSVSINWIQHKTPPHQIPKNINLWFIFYCFAVLASTTRFLIDPTQYTNVSFTGVLIDYYFNGLKFILPALMIYDLCEDKQKAKLAIFAILLGYFVLAFQVVKYMGISDFSGHALNKRGVRVISRDTGYHRVDVSMMLAGASWAVFCLIEIYTKFKHRLVIIGFAGFILLGQALTGGRAGYLAWGATGLFLCIVRWRKLLPLVPLAVIVLFVFMPGISERVFSGFNESSGPIVVENNTDDMTSGRVKIWPHVIDKIGEQPIFGQGREGMKRSGLTEFSTWEIGETWGQPHNAYLELLLDNGIIGALMILPIYILSGIKALKLFVSKGDPIYVTIGGICVSLLLALFVSSIGSQTFYPRQGMIGLWCSMFLAIWASEDMKQSRLIEKSKTPTVSGQ